jgi:hypothetical protein
MSAKTNERTDKRESWHGLGEWERGKDFGKWVTCGKYWRIRELKRQKRIVKCNWELKKVVQIVGNLEWELLKMWKLGNIYRPVSQTLDSWTPFSRISPISRTITYFLFWKLRRILGNIIFQTLHKIHIDSVVFCIK